MEEHRRGDREAAGRRGGRRHGRLPGPGRRAQPRRGSRRGGRRGQTGTLADEPHDVIERRIVTQLQRIVTLDPVLLPDRRKHLRLLDRVDPQIRLQIQIHVQQILRIPRLGRHHRQHHVVAFAASGL